MTAAVAPLADDLVAARAARNGWAPDSGPPATRSTWAPIDLADLVDGAELDDPPELLARTDGICLLYPGRLHSVSGEPESCKGWIALHTAAEVLATGGGVVYIDFEDGPGPIVSRLRALGISHEVIVERFSYLRPNELLDERGWLHVAPLLARAPRLVVIDGITQALSLQGLDLRDNTDVARWLAIPRRLAQTDAALLLLDHVVKDKEARGRFSIGAQYKLAGVDVAYTLEVLEPFGRGREGLVKVWVAKDRPGHVRQHGERQHGGRDLIADMRLVSEDEGGVTIDLKPPLDPAEFRPTVLMERLSRAIEQSPGITKRDLRKVPGKTEFKDKALRLLIAEEFVALDRDGQAHLHRSIKPYRDGDDPGLSSPADGALLKESDG